MKTIAFLRPFTSTRVIKGRFRLSYGNGGAGQGFAFGQWTNHFESGQHATVNIIKGDVLVVTDNPAAGEVVLDGAREGVDFKVVSTMALAA